MQAAQLGFTVRGSLGAAFAKSLWSLVGILLFHSYVQKKDADNDPHCLSIFVAKVGDYGTTLAFSTSPPRSVVVHS